MVEIKVDYDGQLIITCEKPEEQYILEKWRDDFATINSGSIEIRHLGIRFQKQGLEDIFEGDKKIK